MQSKNKYIEYHPIFLIVLKLSINTQKMNELEDWTKADENGIIHAPDELDPLINSIGMQLRFFALSDKAEGKTIIPLQESTKEERKWSSCKHEVMKHINGRKTLRDEYNLILEKKSELSKSCRDWVVSFFTEN